MLADGTQRGVTTRFIESEIDLARPAATSAAPPLDTATGTVKFSVPGAGTVTAARLTQPGFVESTIDL